jgi:hypothetical protein
MLLALLCAASLLGAGPAFAGETVQITAAGRRARSARTRRAATVHGKRTLTRIKGIVLPKRCPRGGWPVASQFSFQDGSTVFAKRTIPCP